MNSQNHQAPSVKNLFNSEPVQLPDWKRAIDLTCCLIALPALCLLTAAMAVMFRLTSRGPIFFKQERVGFKGSRFICYKFRTMMVGADTKSHQVYLDNLLGSRAPMPMIKLDSTGDKRVIKGAWILRATGLDELPQIINIFRKEMSVVGPRPCIPYEYDRYEPWQRERFNAVPGLTGLWQVSGKNRTTFDEMIEYDIKYSETSSFWLDVRIILMTIPALVNQVADTRKARKSKSRLSITTVTIISPEQSPKRSPQAITP